MPCELSTDVRLLLAEHAKEGDSSQQKKKKAGFMAKMKGEALVLLGKVEGKKGHDKVEEGQRIKAGLPARPVSGQNQDQASPSS